MMNATNRWRSWGTALSGPCWMMAWAILTISLVLARLAAPSHAASMVAGGAMSAFQPAAPGTIAPELVLTDASGGTSKLADLKGRVVLLNFWATWCAPCVKEMPSLQSLQRQLGGQDFKVLTVSEDRGGIAVVKKFFAEHNLDGLDMLVDKSTTTLDNFHLRGLPTSLLIDREGREIGRLEGEARWDSPEARALIGRFIDDGAKPDAPIKADTPDAAPKPAG